jgi:frataxin-like iron-binding protein CyaY
MFASRSIFRNSRIQRISSIRHINSHSQSLSLDEFHQKSDSYLLNLQDYLEELDNPLLDVQLTLGVMTLQVDQKIFVINKQPPNLQIWLSSPESYGLNSF